MNKISLVIVRNRNNARQLFTVNGKLIPARFRFMIKYSNGNIGFVPYYPTEFINQ